MSSLYHECSIAPWATIKIKLAIILSALVIWIVYPTRCFANSWPQLSDESRLIECTETLKIAKATFQSNSFDLFPPTIPKGIGSTLVLEPKAGEEEENDDTLNSDERWRSLKSDAYIFDKFSVFHWEKKPNYGIRLVVKEGDFHGDDRQYTLYALRETVSRDEFSVAESSQFKTIIDNSWQPPLIFQEKQSRKTWAVYVGEPSEFLSNWRIYIAGSDGMRQRCTVQFRPPVKNAVNLLPQSVQKLAHLLDQTMGPDVSDGMTQRSIVELRLNVKHTWANATLRPWALPEPYNSRTEVDAGLRAWSEGGPKYLETYKNIQKQYPIAQQSLAALYTKQFHRSASEAMLLAAHVLDIAFRTHYIFPRE